MPSAGKHRNNQSTSVLRVPNQHSQSLYRARLCLRMGYSTTGRNTVNRRSIRSISAMTVLGLALVPSSAISQQKSLKDQLVGAWTLVSADNTAPNGTKRQGYGANPKGILILDAGGRYA
jgi:hypothetical protein